MEKIIILQKDVTDFLENLVQILFDKEYFGFEESAQIYVQKIYDFIESELPDFPPKQTPDELSRFGSEYVLYKANNHTTWYLFFERKDNRYLVTYITNNHVEKIRFL